MTREQEQQIRFNLVVNLKSMTVAELQQIYEWVVGPAPSTIVPATSVVIKK